MDNVNDTQGVEPEPEVLLTAAQMLEKSRTEKIGPATSINVLELTSNEWIHLHEGVKAACRMKVKSTAGIETVDELKERIFSYIHIGGFDRELRRMVTINRIFLRSATDLDTKVSDVVSELISDGLVAELHIGKFDLLISMAHWNFVQSVRTGPGELHKTKLGWLEVALERAGKIESV